MTAALRDHACECRRARCRERIYLPLSRWRGLAPLGRLVVPSHVDDDRVLRRGPGFAVVADDRGELPAA